MSFRQLLLILACTCIVIGMMLVNQSEIELSIELSGDENYQSLKQDDAHIEIDGITLIKTKEHSDCELYSIIKNTMVNYGYDVSGDVDEVRDGAFSLISQLPFDDKAYVYRVFVGGLENEGVCDER